MLMLLDIANDWMNYFGHFHPVVVHLPIGILFIAIILEFIAAKKPSEALDHAILIVLAAGAVSAIISCLFGWFLSIDSGYAETTLALHQWMGISVAVIAIICWLIKYKRGSLFRGGRAYKFALTLLFIMITLTGHFGGSLTHGDDYLTAGLPQPVGGWFGIEEKKDTTHHQRKLIADIKEAFVYGDLVQPALEEKCYSCHGAKKKKGGLRMDEESLLFKGGKHGLVIKAGHPDQSELLIRILLPKDDDKRMPPKDKKSFTKEETALLKWWIQNGADTHKKVKDFPADPAMTPVLASFSAPPKDTAIITPLSKIFDKNPAPAKQEDVNALTALGILISPVAKNSHLLELSCVNYTAFNNGHMPLLIKIAPNIASLKLGNTAITDEAMAQISQCKNLVKLNLSATNITSGGLARLQSLPGLEYLNITGTKINDEGLMLMAKGFPALKHVYCWNSFVTPRGVATLKQQRPGVDAELGDGTK